jgi:hypothetical protein
MDSTAVDYNVGTDGEAMDRAAVDTAGMDSTNTTLALNILFGLRHSALIYSV